MNYFRYALHSPEFAPSYYFLLPDRKNSSVVKDIATLMKSSFLVDGYIEELAFGIEANY